MNKSMKIKEYISKRSNSDDFISKECDMLEIESTEEYFSPVNKVHESFSFNNILAYNKGQVAQKDRETIKTIPKSTNIQADQTLNVYKCEIERSIEENYRDEYYFDESEICDSEDIKSQEDQEVDTKIKGGIIVCKRGSTSKQSKQIVHHDRKLSSKIILQQMSSY